MADLDIRETDLVLIRLSLRGRDGGSPLSLNETVVVRDLGLALGGAGGDVPLFDGARFAELMKSGSAADREAALQMQADFMDATAEFVAGGGTPPAEQLASAIVDWVVRTQPKGHRYTTNVNGEGYIISKEEINITGPVAMDGDRVWRVTAVGTWGC